MRRQFAWVAAIIATLVLQSDALADWITPPAGSSSGGAATSLTLPMNQPGSVTNPSTEVRIFQINGSTHLTGGATNANDILAITGSQALDSGGGHITSNHSSGVYGIAYGYDSNPAGIVDRAPGIIGVSGNQGAGTVTTAIDVYGHNDLNSGGGTLTNHYFLYQALSTAATNEYGAYFSAPVGVGIDQPTYNLDVYKLPSATNWARIGNGNGVVLFTSTGTSIFPATGGAKGAGTFNATALYSNGTQVVPTSAARITASSGSIAQVSGATLLVLDLWGPGGPGGNGINCGSGANCSGGAGGGAGGHLRVLVQWSILNAAGANGSCSVVVGQAVAPGGSPTDTTVTCGTIVYTAYSGGAGQDGQSAANSVGGGGAGGFGDGVAGASGGTAGTPANGGSGGGGAVGGTVTNNDGGSGGGGGQNSGNGTRGGFGVAGATGGGAGGGCTGATTKNGGNGGQNAMHNGAAGGASAAGNGIGGTGAPGTVSVASGTASTGATGGTPSGGGGGAGSGCNAAGTGGTGGTSGPGLVDYTQS